MHNTKSRNTKYGHLGFYLVMALCVAMIGISCWFAYTQTADELTLHLDSALDSAHSFTVAERETAVPTETQPAAEQPVQEWVMEMETKPEEPADAPVMDVVVVSPEEELPADVPEEDFIPATVSTAAMRYPVEGEILKEFSNGELVKSETTGIWQTHNGIDIACTNGDAVYAMDKGIVSDIGEDPLWGICVTVDHQNGVYSRYCGMNANLDVSVGDNVSTETVLGAAGNTADVESAMPSHLHFELMQGEQYLDPAAYIDGE